MTCTCSRIHVGGKPVNSFNWNPDCKEHGVGTDWYDDPDRAVQRAKDNERTIDLQRRAREARKAARSE